MLDWMVAFDRMMMVKQVRIVYFTFSKPIYQPFDSVWPISIELFDTCVFLFAYQKVHFHNIYHGRIAILKLNRQQQTKKHSIYRYFYIIKCFR